jgi:hypothetical protein
MPGNVVGMNQVIDYAVLMSVSIPGRLSACGKREGLVNNLHA